MNHESVSDSAASEESLSPEGDDDHERRVASSDDLNEAILPVDAAAGTKPLQHNDHNTT